MKREREDEADDDDAKKPHTEEATPASDAANAEPAAESEAAATTEPPAAAPEQAEEQSSAAAAEPAPAEPPPAAPAPPPPPAAVAPPPDLPPLQMVATLLATNPGLADGPDIMLYSDPAQADVEFKFDLHIDAIAAIFGTGGRTITTIRQQTNCRIRLLPPGSDPDRRVFELSGAQEACMSAEGLILAELQKMCADNPNVVEVSGTGAMWAVRILVRSEACGSLIGKAGSNINQVRGQHGSSTAAEQQHTRSRAHAPSCVSLSLSLSSKQMRQNSGADIKIAAAEQGGSTAMTPLPGMGIDRLITLSGAITSVHAALIDIIPRIAAFIGTAKLKPGYGTGAQMAAASSGGGGGGGGSTLGGGTHPLEQGPPGHVHPVPSTAVGRVIGPGGVRIREIRDKTGARVRVGNDCMPGTQDRPLTIWGTPEQVHKQSSSSTHAQHSTPSKQATAVVEPSAHTRTLPSPPERTDQRSVSDGERHYYEG